MLSLLLTAALTVSGAHAHDHAGSVIAGAGDVNGDGIPDMIVGERFAGSGRAGAAYVVFGRRGRGRVELGRLGSQGFRVDGPGRDAFAGSAVAGAGDVNGDGLDDVIAGDPSGSPGHAYVVFGSRGNEDVNAESLGTRGFAISAGSSVAGVGDMNRDGLADVAVLDDDIGSAYVVFGAASSAPVDLAALGARGFRVAPLTKPDDGFDTVAAAGDVNGDGRPDLLLGASGEDLGRHAGGAWVVYGSSSTRTVGVSHIGGRGFHIRGRPGDELGPSIDGAGDIDGDGHADLVLGSSARGAGAVYIVFGGAHGEADLARLGRGGIRLPEGARGSRSVAGIQNADGNGHDGILVGSPSARRGGRASVGAASLYVSRRRAR